MPFAALCRKCKLDKRGEGDDSYAYMIGQDFFDIKKEINKHFKDVHNASPQPSPNSLSWTRDFTIEYVELTQYGGIEQDMSHLTFTFRTRQFSSEDYKISVITHHHYDECVRRIENKRENARIDVELYEYF